MRLGLFVGLCAGVCGCAAIARSGDQDDAGLAAHDAHVTVDLGTADLTQHVGPVADMTISCIVPLVGEFCPPVIYVSTTGSDFNSGEMPAFPVRTIPTAIAKALKCQGAPCPIVVAGGTYDGQVVLRDGLTILGGYTQDFLKRDPVVGSFDPADYDTEFLFATAD